MTDDHAAHAMSAYGSRINQTPQLDRLAQGGVRFDRCFAVNAICTPSRACILTGKYSHKNGVTVFNAFDGSQPHLGKYLQGVGYQTAMVGKWHLESEPTGFNYWNVLPGQGDYHNPVMIEMGRTNKLQGYVTDLITDLSIDWVKKRDRSKPFCLFLHHKAPHRNWQPDAKHADMYEGVDIPEPDTLRDDYATRGRAAVEARMRMKHLTTNDLKGPVPAGLSEDQELKWRYQRYIKDYLRCIASVDDNVGRVLDFLDQEGLTQNTVVVYTSDQGFFLGDHGWFDKRFMYDESIRMPLLVKYPPMIRPSTVNTGMVLNVDFAPTFLELAGVKIPSDMQGRSLVPLWNANGNGKMPGDWRTFFYYRYYHYPGDHRVHAHYGLRTETEKLIYYPALKEWEMYDLVADPKEMRNLARVPGESVRLERLKRELIKEKRRLGDEDQFAVAATHDLRTLSIFAGGGDSRKTDSPPDLKMEAPFGVDEDGEGNLYSVELNGNRVWKITADYRVVPFAGTGEKGEKGDGGLALECEFNGPHHVLVLPQGDVLVADTWNQRVRRIDAKTGLVSTLAGTGIKGYSGDGGPAIDAQFGGIYCLALDPRGRLLYLVDLDNRRIRVVDTKTGRVETFAGNGEKGVPKNGALAKESPLVDPRAVAVGRDGVVYILERGGNALRAVGRDGRIRTLAGTGEKGGITPTGSALAQTLNGPKHLAVEPKGDILIADTENHVIRRVDPKRGTMSVVVGNGKKGVPGQGGYDGAPLSTALNQPHGIFISRTGSAYISDSSNQRILRWER